MTSQIAAPDAALSIIKREHAAARAQRELARTTPSRAAPDNQPGGSDFRTSERHRHAYLSIGPDQGCFLFSLIVASGAKSIVEFGSSFGISTLYLAAAAARTGGYVTGSEFHEEKATKATTSLREAGLEQYATIAVGDARETLATFRDGIDFLFLDGAKELYLPILEMLEPKLMPNALVVADNLNYFAEDDPFLAHIGSSGYVTSTPAFGKGSMSVSIRLGGEA